MTMIATMKKTAMPSIRQPRQKPRQLAFSCVFGGVPLTWQGFYPPNAHAGTSRTTEFPRFARVERVGQRVSKTERQL